MVIGDFIAEYSIKLAWMRNVRGGISACLQMCGRSVVTSQNCASDCREMVCRKVFCG